MAFSLVAELYGLEGAQYNALSSMSKGSLSANAILDQLKGLGLGINRSNGLKAIKAFKESYGLAGLPAAINSAGTINFNNVPFAVSNQRMDYAYWLQLTGTDRVTQQLRTINYKLSTNIEYETTQEAVDAAIEEIEEDGSAYGLDDIEGNVTHITARQGT